MLILSQKLYQDMVNIIAKFEGLNNASFGVIGFQS